jgi:hypothetical protein
MLQLMLSSVVTFVVIGGCGYVGNALALSIMSTAFAAMMVRQAVSGTRSSSAWYGRRFVVEDDPVADADLALVPIRRRMSREGLDFWCRLSCDWIFLCIESARNSVAHRELCTELQRMCCYRKFHHHQM